MTTPRTVRRARQFRTIWRINAVIILAIGVMGVLGLCAGAVSLVYALIANARYASPGAPAPGAQPEASEGASRPKKEWQLGEMQVVGGTPWRMLPQSLESEDDGKRGMKFSSYDGYGNYLTRNYLFLNTRTFERHFLLPNSDAVIWSAERIGEGSATAKKPVRWIEYRTVRADTNGDGRLDRKDRFEVAYSDAAGKGYRPLLSGVEAVIDAEMQGPDNRLIVFRKQGRTFAALLDLRAGRVERQQAVPVSTAD